MTDLLRTGLTFLNAARAAHMAHDVEYWAVAHRGADPITLTATVGATTFSVERTGGVFEEVASRDFIFTTADLVLVDTLIEPEAGDQVKETIGGVVKVFEVAAPGDEPPWRYTDPSRLSVRVHTNAVDTE